MPNTPAIPGSGTAPDARSPNIPTIGGRLPWKCLSTSGLKTPTYSGVLKLRCHPPSLTTSGWQYAQTWS